MRKLGFWIVYIIYILLFLADLISTLYLKEIGRVLESNMAYKYIGFTGIILLNGAIIWLLWWIYSRSKTTPTARFFLIMSMLMIISVRIYAIQNAWYYISNPITLQLAKAIATPEAMAETTRQVVYLAYPPFILSVIGFLFWKLDHKIQKKGDETNGI